MKPIIVVPTYNETANIEPLFAQIAAAVPGVPVLVADDGSPDGTATRVESLACRYPLFSVLRRTGPRGLGRAYVDAFTRLLAQDYDRFVQMDADLSHNPAYLPALLAASEQHDVVIGSRYVRDGGVENWPRNRVLLSRYANVYVRCVAGIPVADATAGFRCWSRRALEAINLATIASEGYSFQVEMIYRAHRLGFSIAESPIVFTDRQFGQSKMSGKVILESVKLPWRLRLRERHVGTVQAVRP